MPALEPKKVKCKKCNEDMWTKAPNRKFCEKCRGKVKVCSV